MKKYICLLIVILLNGSASSFAQVEAKEYDLFSPDSLFIIAQQVNTLDRKKARALCYIALNKQKLNAPVRLFLAKGYAEDNLLGNSREEIKHALKANPQYMEAFRFAADLEFNEKNYEDAIKYCNRGLSVMRSDQQLLEIKALSLIELKQTDSAISALNTLLYLNPEHEKANALLYSLTVKEYLNRISVAYGYNHFNKIFGQEHIMGLEFYRGFGFGSFIAQTNYAIRDTAMGVQVGLKAFPKIRENTSGYLGAEVGSGAVFPKLKLGMEIFRQVEKIKLEASLGVRHLQFREKINYTSLTSSITKLFGTFELGARVFLTPMMNASFRPAAFMHGRYYLSTDRYLNKNRYVGLLLGYGASPDDINDTRNDLFFSQSLRVGLNTQQLLSENVLLNLSVQYASDNKLINDPAEMTINRLSAGIKLGYRF